MNSAVRHTSWSQGNVLPEAAVEALGLSSAKDQYAVVITHDCDLAAELDKEPNCEIIVASTIERLGAHSHAKNARHLDLEFQRQGTPLVVQLVASNKSLISKEHLFAFEPRTDLTLTRESRNTLKRWLAARYDRAAFPGAFEENLKPVKEKIARCLDKHSEHILALYFDLDEGELIERKPTDSPYQLRIYVLYNSRVNESAASKAGEAVATQLEAMFIKAYEVTPNQWSGIELLSCDATSDNAMTIAQRLLLSEWRLDHLSLRADPQQTIQTA